MTKERPIWDKCLLPNCAHNLNPLTYGSVVLSWEEEERQGGGKQHPWGPGLEPGTYRVLGEGPQPHPSGVV